VDQIDKLPIHLKYFCGDSAERTEAQARQRRNPDRDEGGNERRRGRRPGSNTDGDGKSGVKKKETKKMMGKNAAKKAGITNPPTEVDADADRMTPRSRRSAALKAASQISRSAADWMPPDGDDDDDGVKNFRSDSESESSSVDVDSDDSDSSSDSELERAREKQRQALKMSKAAKKPTVKAKKQRAPSQVEKGKTPAKKKPAAKTKAKGRGKAKPKKFDDDSDDSSYSSSDSELGEIENEIDMAALMEKAMAGAKNSVLHSLCWWRIVLGEAVISRY
jgi:hypothetical protein